MHILNLIKQYHTVFLESITGLNVWEFLLSCILANASCSQTLIFVSLTNVWSYLLEVFCFIITIFLYFFANGVEYILDVYWILDFIFYEVPV